MTQTLTQYITAFKRNIHPVKDMTEAEKLIYFTRGMQADLAPLCVTDGAGNKWKTLEALWAHARTKEKELIARKQVSAGNTDRPPKNAQGRGRYGRYGKQGRGEKYSLAAVSGGTEKVQTARGRGGDRGGGREGGRGHGGRGRGRGSDHAGSQDGYVSDGRPMPRGQPNEPSPCNKKISNAQHEWCMVQNRCLHCFLDMRECREARAEPKKCKLRDKGEALKKGTHGGAPDWNGNK